VTRGGSSRGVGVVCARASCLVLTRAASPSREPLLHLDMTWLFHTWNPVSTWSMKSLTTPCQRRYACQLAVE